MISDFIIVESPRRCYTYVRLTKREKRGEKARAVYIEGTAPWRSRTTPTWMVMAVSHETTHKIVDKLEPKLRIMKGANKGLHAAEALDNLPEKLWKECC